MGVGLSCSTMGVGVKVGGSVRVGVNTAVRVGVKVGLTRVAVAVDVTRRVALGLAVGVGDGRLRSAARVADASAPSSLVDVGVAASRMRLSACSRAACRATSPLLAMPIARRISGVTSAGTAASRMFKNERWLASVSLRATASCAAFCGSLRARMLIKWEAWVT